MIAARNIISSGGTQATAEVVAYSILAGENEGGKGIFGRKKVNQAAKSQAEIVASLSLLTANDTFDGSMLSDDLSPSLVELSEHQPEQQAVANKAVRTTDSDEPSRMYVIPHSASESENVINPSFSHDISSAPLAEKDTILFTTAKTRSALKNERTRDSNFDTLNTSPINGWYTKKDSNIYDIDEEEDVTYVSMIQESILNVIGANSLSCLAPTQDNKLEGPSQGNETRNWSEAVSDIGSKGPSACSTTEGSKIKNRSQAAASKHSIASKASKASKRDKVKSSNLSRKSSNLSRTSNVLPKFSIKQKDTTLLIQGFAEVEPLPGGIYFPVSAARNENLANMRTPAGRPFRVISLCIPCYNEDAAALKRSIKTLKDQRLPRHVSLEVVVVMDGIEQISSSMRKYIAELFGISTKVDHPNNPFTKMPAANTVLVERSNDSALDTSQLHLSLAIKRKNRRKVNSQMWWLRSHAKEVQCEFTFGTDCGIVFNNDNIAMMLRRLDSEPNMAAVTGYLRVMSSNTQGDGAFEICTNPLGWFLRQLQSYDIELSQSTTKSCVDTIGFLPVLPGPCTLYRFQHLAGVMHEYFSLTTKELDADSSGIILGNVQLAEDRFPPVLLTFRSPEDCDDAGIVRPRTGFLRDAVFYFEAEKPLGQFVKQRRRWINGAFIAVYWVLHESWIRNSDHSYFTKLGAWFLLAIELLQGAFVRLFVPATIACGLSFMCTILPSIIEEDNEAIRNVLKLEGIGADQFGLGAIAAAAYLLVYAIFMLAHTPRAVKVELPNGETKWTPDSGSAYRPWLFAISFLTNAIVVVLFLYVGIGVFLTVGWHAAPLYFRILTIFSALPYVVALVDGLVNSKPPNIKSFLMIVAMTPVFYVASIWFYVWLPSYASARISDLSWGNRAGSHVEESGHGNLRRRALVGRFISLTLVVSNALTAGLVLGLVHAVAGFLNFVFFTLLAFNILLSVMNLVDMVFRAIYPLTGNCCRCLVGELPPLEPAEREKYANSNPGKDGKPKLEIVPGSDNETTDESESESDGNGQILAIMQASSSLAGDEESRYGVWNATQTG